MKPFLIVSLLVVISSCALADSVPKDQEGSGGLLYSIELPRGIELYSNALLQEYLFLVDFDSKGKVVAVHLRNGPTVNDSHNAKILSAAIKKWKVVPFVMNGKTLEKSGAYYTILVGRESKSGADFIRVSNGVVRLVQSVLPSPSLTALSEAELKKFHRKSSGEGRKEKAEPPAGEENLFPE